MQIPFRLVEDKLKFSEANICIRNSQDFPSESGVLSHFVFFKTK